MRTLILFVFLAFLQPLYAIESPEAYAGISSSEETVRDQIKELERTSLGVYYERDTKQHFKKIEYKFRVGSLKNNIHALVQKYGYKLHWNLDTDYDIPGDFVIKNKTLPEIVAESTVHLPIKTMFYTRNRLVTMFPMYDKKESDFSNEYTVDTRK